MSDRTANHSEPERGNKSQSDSVSSPEESESVSWTRLSLEELTDAYWAIIAPQLEADGLDPETDKPTHQWLRDNDFRSLLYTLREHHDRTFAQFWSEDLALDATEDEYEWATDHDRTIEAIESFLSSRRERKGLAESSIETLQYRLNRYVRAYRNANQNADLLTPVARESDAPAYEAVDECWAAFDRLHDTLDGGQTKRRIHLAVSNWYDHLVRRKWASVNPADGLDDEFDWSGSSADGEEGDTPCLSSGHVHDLYRATSDQEERLLVLALCAWGLRPNEVASLHSTQFVLDPTDGETPYIQFDERKNGPGEVSILYGREEISEFLATNNRSSKQSGFLFPSSHSSRDHISRWTVWNRFGELVDRAGLPNEIDGVSPAPKMGRRFWYDVYSSSLDVILNSLDEIAADQGSSSPEVVLQNYLSESRARQLRREYMREQLSAAFD